MTQQPKPEAATFDPEAFGLDTETLMQLETHAASVATQKMPKPRAGMLDGPRTFLASPKGLPVVTKRNVEKARLVITSVQNKHAQRHADAMYDLWADAMIGAAKPKAAIKEIEAYEIGGTNTYALALRRYRDLLVTHLKAHTANPPAVKTAKPAAEPQTFAPAPKGRRKAATKEANSPELVN